MINLDLTTYDKQEFLVFLIHMAACYMVIANGARKKTVRISEPIGVKLLNKKTTMAFKQATNVRSSPN